jgi:hypothetical protein
MMARYVLVAMNGPTPDGDAEELERWYAEVHMADLKSVDGIKTARRFRTLRGHVPGAELWPNVAIYEIETDDIAAVSAQMQEKLRPFHPAFDRSRSAHIFAVQIAGDE